MKKLNLIGKMALVATLFAPMACSDSLLEEKFYTQVADENFLRNAEEVQAAVGAAYTRLYGLMNHGSYFSTQEVNSNEILIPQRGGDWFDGGQWINTHRHVQTGKEDCYNNAWTWLYGGVNTCNRLIKQVDGAVKAGNLDAATGADFAAELRGLRAMFYYWLCDSFGNAPLVTSFDDVSLPTNENAGNRAKVYAFVESELTAILPLLKASAPSNYGRFTQEVANGFLAHLYLNAGVYTGTQQNAKALAAANAIIGPKFRLAGSYRENFATENAASPEFIFAIPYDKVFAQGFNLPQMTLHYASQATFNLQAQPWNGYCVATDFYNSFDAGDVRKTNNFVVGPQFSSTGARLEDNGAETADPDGKPLTFTADINQIEPNCLRQAGARIGKFEFANGATPNLSNDFPILRIADIMLIKAEALCRIAGNWDLQEAKDIVNEIRNRAGLGNMTGAMTADSFSKERSQELFYEGWYRSDLIRFGKFNEPRGIRAQEGLAASAASKALWPIPVPQLNANSNLKQNAGY